LRIGRLEVMARVHPGWYGAVTMKLSLVRVSWFAMLPALAAAGCAATSPSAPAASAPPERGPAAAASLTATPEAPKAADAFGNRAPIRPVTETLHGVTVTDPYRYLENGDDPDTRAFFDAQAKRGRGYLDRLPQRDRLLHRLHELYGRVPSMKAPARAGGVDVFLRRTGGDEVARLFVRPQKGGATRLLLDPAQLRDGKHHATILDFALAPDGRHAVVGIARDGDEYGELRFVEVATGKLLPDVVRGCFPESADWLDARRVEYLGYSEAAFASPNGNRFQHPRARAHVLGEAPERDVTLLGAGVNASLPLEANDFAAYIEAEDSPFVVASIGRGTRSDRRVYVTAKAGFDPKTAVWRQLADFDDFVRAAAPHGNDLYLLRRDTPRGRLVRLDLRRGRLADAQEVLAESPTVALTRLVLAKDGVYVAGLEVTETRLTFVPYQGRGERSVPLPPGVDASINGSPREPGIRAVVSGYTQPPQVLEGSAGGTLRPLPLVPQATGLPALHSEIVWVPAKDGVRVPMTLVHGEGAVRDGRRPTLLWAYGAYGIWTSPFYSVKAAVLAERGGVFAICHARGGGELGEPWRKAGFQATKHRTWEDTIACGEWLVQNGYTSPDYLGVSGGSAGGITVGNAIVERPDLFAVAFSFVGVHNTLRSQTMPTGPANIPEYGDAATEEGFRSLLAMDSYLKVKDGVRYPATLLITGLNDPRVSSWQPAKMAARLQAATTGPEPVLMRIDGNDGHGVGSAQPQREAQDADQLAFLFAHTGKGARRGPGGDRGAK
jgi:prolyl oligopeptidase